jgi:hypothetical protein
VRSGIAHQAAAITVALATLHNGRTDGQQTNHTQKAERETPNASPSGKKKATPKQKGGGKKQGRHK